MRFTVENELDPTRGGAAPVNRYIDPILEYVIKGIVDTPEKVVIDKQEENEVIIFNVQVDKNDMGKLIGKAGQTIQSIRVLLKLIASKLKAKIILKIAEPEIV